MSSQTEICISVLWHNVKQNKTINIKGEATTTVDRPLLVISTALSTALAIAIASVKALTAQFA